MQWRSFRSRLNMDPRSSPGMTSFSGPAMSSQALRAGVLLVAGETPALLH